MESKDRKERERKGLESLHNDFWDVFFYLPYLYYFIYGVLKTNLEFLFPFTRENTI